METKQITNIQTSPAKISTLKSSIFTPEQINILKRSVADGASIDEFTVFLYQCDRTKLDPFARQIYFIKRSGKFSVEVSIDGARLIAQRSNNYAGQDKPIWELDKNGKVISCEVTVYKFSPNYTRYAASTGVAFWDEYKPKVGQDHMWLKMPRTMIAKCAEMLALRKAFPNELSGLYSSEEMAQSTSEVVSITPKVNTSVITQKILNKILELKDKLNPTTEQLATLLEGRKLKDLSLNEVEKLIHKMEVLMEEMNVKNTIMIEEKQMARIHVLMGEHNLEREHVKEVIGIKSFKDLTKEIADDLIKKLNNPDLIQVFVKNTTNISHVTEAEILSVLE